MSAAAKRRAAPKGSPRKVIEAAFTITGEGLTRLARGFLLDGDPAKAYRFLQKALVGDGAERVIPKILDGDMRLTGSSHGPKGLGVARCSAKDEAAKRHKEQAAYIYAGRVRIEDKWMRPAARVTAFGEEDGEHAAMGLDVDPEEALAMPSASMAKTVFRDVWKLRVGFYAYDGEKVVETEEAPWIKKAGDFSGDLVIFEPCGEPPHWHDPILTPKDAVRDFLKHHKRLPERGADEANLTIAQHENPLERITDAWNAAMALALSARAERAKEDAAERERAAAREARFQKQDEEEALAYAERIAVYRETIRAQAGKDTFDLVVPDVGTFHVPTAPFWRWAFRGTALHGTAPPWENVCPSGMKCQMDDRNHTDWMVGAGIGLEHAYSGPIHDEASRVRFDLIWKRGEADMVVLSPGDGRAITGRVGGEIVVLPDLRADHLWLIALARAVIAEKGGVLAHLCQVAIEKNIPVFLVEDARSRFPVGTLVTIDAAHPDEPNERSLRVGE